MQSNSNKFFIVLIFLLIVGLIYLLSPILTPFLFAALLAYLGDPMVERLTKLGLPRLVSVIIIFIGMFMVILLLILLFVPLIQKQIKLLILGIPAFLTWIQVNILPLIDEKLNLGEVFNLDAFKTVFLENFAKAGNIASGVFKTVIHSGFALVEVLINLLLIPVVTFYLLRDWQIILTKSRQALPTHLKPQILQLFSECNLVLSAFFRGQLLVMLSLGVIYATGLSLIKLQLSLIIGLIAGLLSIVPYLGFISGIVIASIAAFSQFNSFSAVLLVWLVFGIGQFLESTILTPKLVGDRIGLHPVVVIFAILAGGTLFGFFGVLLALPVTAVIVVVLHFFIRNIHHLRFSS